MTVGLPVMMSLILSTLDLSNEQIKVNEGYRSASIRDFFSEGSLEQFNQQILFTVILSIVKDG